MVSYDASVRVQAIEVVEMTQVSYSVTLIDEISGKG